MINNKTTSVIANIPKQSPKRKWDYIVCLSFTMTIVLLSFLSSCDSHRVFEDNQSVTDEKWDYTDVKSFTYEATDTTTKYNLLINLRHSFAFEWRNVYVNVETTFPDGHKTNSRVNLLLSEPDGHWFGKCVGDNCFISIPIKQNVKFPHTGKYTFSIGQDMRVNPLPLVRNVGFRIEKAESLKTTE